MVKVVLSILEDLVVDEVPHKSGVVSDLLRVRLDTSVVGSDSLRELVKQSQFGLNLLLNLLHEVPHPPKLFALS